MNAEHLTIALDAIDHAVTADPGGRGIAGFLVTGGLAGAVKSLAQARGVVLVTGFHILSAGMCENDGPLGLMALADALEELAMPCRWLTDRFCADALSRAGLAPLDIHDEHWRFPADTTHLIAAERAGRTADGRCRNMRGQDITDFTGPLDELFLRSERPTTIGIGDGGNEIGMGLVRERVVAALPLGERIACVVECDHTVVAGTANWGVWAIVAGLSLIHGRDLLPGDAVATAQLDSLSAAGIVDGVAGVPGRSVDGIAWDGNLAVLRRLREVVAESLQ